MSKPPILVTGAHRSGTTWIGKILSEAEGVEYVHEPLNVNLHKHRPGTFARRAKYWYTYICDANDRGYEQAFRDIVNFRFHPVRGLKELGLENPAGGNYSPAEMKFINEYIRYANAHFRKDRALLKDPFAVFSIPWFDEKLSADIVVTIRHPAGFVSSLKRLGWRFDLNDFLKQPLLIRDHLSKFSGELENAVHASPQMPDIQVNALTWKCIYAVVAKYQRENPHWHFVRQEDFARNPVHRFKELFYRLNLPFTAIIEKSIIRSSSRENPLEASKNNPYETNVDSQATIKSWRKRLDSEEIGMIFDVTRGVAEEFYSEDDWE
ncbi:sulfotransferase [bacterium]|nr:sulfotransferase [bacterium]